MKKLTYILTAALALAFLNSCDAIEKATEHREELENITFELSADVLVPRSNAAVVITPAISRAENPETPNYFETPEPYTVVYSDYVDSKVAAWIKSITYEEVYVAMSTLSGAGIKVSDLTINASWVDGETPVTRTFALAYHDFATNLSTKSSLELLGFMNNVLGAFASKKAITFTASGYTNITEGQALDIAMEIVDPVVYGGLSL